MYLTPFLLLLIDFLLDKLIDIKRKQNLIQKKEKDRNRFKKIIFSKYKYNQYKEMIEIYIIE